MPKINIGDDSKISESIEFISSMCRKYISNGCRSCPLKYNGEYNRHLKECWAEINCSSLFPEIEDFLCSHITPECEEEYANLLKALAQMSMFCDSYTRCKDCPFDDSSSNKIGSSLCNLTNLKPCDWQGVLSSVCSKISIDRKIRNV